MADTKRKNSKKSTDTSSTAHLVRSSARGALIGILVSVVLAIISCVIAFYSKDPDSLLTPLSMLSLYVPAFIAGVVAIRKKGDSSLLCGLLSGVIFMLFYMLVSLFFSPEDSSGYSLLLSLALHALIVLFSVLGSYAGKRHTKKRKRR